MKTHGFIFLCVLSIGALVLTIGYSCRCLGHPFEGLTREETLSVLQQLPQDAPIAYLRRVLPDQRTLVVGTGLYFVDDDHSRSANIFIFAQVDEEWSLVFKSNMDRRVDDRELPTDWEIRLADVRFADLTGDGNDEIVVTWDSEPRSGISLSQYTSIVHVYHYDEATNAFSELTDDRIVYDTDLERVLLLDVDEDPEQEIALFEGIWESDSCVICSKRVRITLWSFANGEKTAEPNWNSGEPFETQEKLSLKRLSVVDLHNLLMVGMACADETTSSE